MFENSRLEMLSHAGSQIDRMNTATQLCCQSVRSEWYVYRELIIVKVSDLALQLGKTVNNFNQDVSHIKCSKLFIITVNTALTKPQGRGHSVKSELQGHWFRTWLDNLITSKPSSQIVFINYYPATTPHKCLSLHIPKIPLVSLEAFCISLPILQPRILFQSILVPATGNHWSKV